MTSLSFDTGALINLVDAKRQSMRKIYDVAVSSRTTMRVSAVVVAEWWRQGRGETQRGEWLRSMRVEPVTDAIARMAGVAVGQVRGAGTIDAIVMATALLAGDVAVYTSDIEDLTTLRDGFIAFEPLHVFRA